MVPNDTVKLTSSVERTIKNTSSYSERIRNYVEVDEWEFPAGKSEILECTLTVAGKVHPAGPSKPAGPYSIRTGTREVTLEPGATATLRSKYIEYKRTNDISFYHSSTPTVNPEIEVKCPGFECDIGFGTPNQNVHQSYYATRKQLTGTYLPHQYMSVRWWPKSQSGGVSSSTG